MARKIERIPYPMSGIKKERYLVYEAKLFKRITSNYLDNNIKDVIWISIFKNKNKFLKGEVLLVEIYKKNKRVKGRSFFDLFYEKDNIIIPMNDKEIENTIFENLLDYAFKFNLKKFILKNDRNESETD